MGGSKVKGSVTGLIKITIGGSLMALRWTKISQTHFKTTYCKKQAYKQNYCNIRNVSRQNYNKEKKKSQSNLHKVAATHIRLILRNVNVITENK